MAVTFTSCTLKLNNLQIDNFSQKPWKFKDFLHNMETDKI